MTTAEPLAAPRPRSIWSFVLCGIAIPAGVLAVAAFTLHRFAGPWSEAPGPAGEVPWFWMLVATAAALGIVAAIALGSRRWFSAVAAIAVAGFAGVLALGVLEEVRHLLEAPAVEVPLPCQCRSGGDCGCPGG